MASGASGLATNSRTRLSSTGSLAAATASRARRCTSRCSLTMRSTSPFVGDRLRLAAFEEQAARMAAADRPPRLGSKSQSTTYSKARIASSRPSGSRLAAVTRLPTASESRTASVSSGSPIRDPWIRAGDGFAIRKPVEARPQVAAPLGQEIEVTGMPEGGLPVVRLRGVGEHRLIGVAEADALRRLHPPVAPGIGLRNHIDREIAAIAAVVADVTDEELALSSAVISSQSTFSAPPIATSPIRFPKHRWRRCGPSLRSRCAPNRRRESGGS